MLRDTRLLYSIETRRVATLRLSTPAADKKGIRLFFTIAGVDTRIERHFAVPSQEISSQLYDEFSNISRYLSIPSNNTD